MKVSVVIPAHNEEKYIAKCLQQFKKQTVQPDEIIVVNNNSTDKTASILKKFNVRVIDEKKPGVISARNAGYDAAQYDIIARCDADCLVPPHWIERIKFNFETKSIDALTGPLHYHDLPVKNVTPVFNTYLSMISKLIKHYPLHGPNMAITRKIWLAIRDSVCLDDSTVHEDHDISIHIHQRGGKIEYDRYLIVKTSGRRIRNDPTTFFIEYPVRIAKTLRKHNVKLIDF